MTFTGKRTETRRSYNNHSLDGDRVWDDRIHHDHHGRPWRSRWSLRRGPWEEIFHLHDRAWRLSWWTSHCSLYRPLMPLLQEVSRFWNWWLMLHWSSCFFRICGLCGGSGSTDFSASSTNVSMRQSGVMAEGAAFRSFKDTVSESWKRSEHKKPNLIIKSKTNQNWLNARAL